MASEARAGAQFDGEARKQDLIGGYLDARRALDEALAALPPQAPVAGWTALEIAAHVAAWERRASELVPSLVHGTPAPDVDVDRFNAIAAAAARGCDPDGILRDYREAGSALASALGEAPARAFARGRLVDQVAMERQHCLEHAAELRAAAARQAAEAPVVEAPRDQRQELIAAYHSAHRRLAEVVAAHPDAVYGSWTGREVLAHVAGWAREAAAIVPRLAAGEPSPDYSDDAAWNARFVERVAGLSDDELCAEYEEAGRAFEAMLATLPDSAVETGAPGADWAAGLADHALEHAGALDDAA